MSSFQTDLASVSVELKDLQDRSKAIERRGGGRRVRDLTGPACVSHGADPLFPSVQVIEKPLRSLVESIIFPPDLIQLIQDSPVTDAWLPAIEQFDTILTDVERRKGRVKAAADSEPVGESLRLLVRPHPQNPQEGMT